MNIEISCVCSALAAEAIGTRVVAREEFFRVVETAILRHDGAGDRVAGQHAIPCPEALPYISAGVGRHTGRPEDYVVRQHRGKVGAYLRREFAAPAESCLLIIYSKDAYLADPDCEPGERNRILESGADYVVVAVLAAAGPRSPYSPGILVHNLAGGNHEAATWSLEEIRELAKQSEQYWTEWCTVAD